ncbi:MAG: oxidoreductase [Reyranella sp.]|jgi:acrylyl-CoA reductase (NADPH)|uniref:MDR family oxidoreductase n=1 Tax=Reyranella sp. TaxID=1929291 RepID=UPI000963BE0E|nr:MDR family oxidoreductase [Reyranella sp.]MBN9539128.1 oxidoreductase [Alphaproteobacteria bacterium]MBR2816897.1 oxidoreductase [Reyranella sp.]OJU32655.1 MAG: oxidoreductase [Alphaproteobacteria bacterium 65-37]
MSFRALVLSQGADRKVSGTVETLSEDRLPAGDVTVAVDYSTLNYKDGLVLTSGGGLVKTWPHVGGIDFAGTVEASDNPGFKAGDKVVLNGWRVGEIHWGGYATKARVKGDWLVKLPAAISTKRAMAIGTAGYTSMLCVIALEKHGLKPASGEILVTGAAGGVGSVAVAILAKLGYNVVAATGRPQEGDYLKSLGATTILDRKELTEAPDRPLLSERFAGVVDTVSGVMFARALAQVKYGGAAAVCGLAAGPAFPGSILPFILRSVSVYGIDSVMLPKGPREEAWKRLGTDLPLDKLDSTVSDAGLSDLMALGPKILKGEVRGRVVVDVSK